MPRIAKIHPGSLAEELELEAGDEILKINGETVKDIIDFQYALAAEDLELEVKKADGELWVLEVDKDYDEGLGVDWDNPTVDRVHLCHNKCVFCFVDQIPSNMRQTLNVRDDDYRLSFLHGNFVTLTNVKDDELKRIVDLRMTPLNVSVHTTNPELRVRMLANKRSGEILRQIEYLAENEIEMNTQVVLCPEWNDGAELDRTIRDLVPFYPAVKNVSVVPVGLTKHRRGLHKLRGCTPGEARQVIQQVEQWQNELRQTLGVSFVYAADEFYVMADMLVPPSDFYDGFGQTENGVGVIRTFLEEVEEVMPRIPMHAKAASRHVGIVTGSSAAQTVRQTTMRLSRIKGLKIDVFPIINDFYGHNVTVTGLITGRDIVSQLEGKLAGIDTVLLPDIMLKDEDDVFLDDYTVEQVVEGLCTHVTVVPATGSGLMFGALGYTNALPPRRRYEATLRAIESPETLAYGSGI